MIAPGQENQAGGSGMSQPPVFLPGTGNAFGFAATNALSFQMILGGPMVLYAKSLGASATILGLIAGMLPLMVVLQIPAARHVDRAGYKVFVVTGWAVRTFFVALIACVPLLPEAVPAGVRLGLVLVLLFLFNAVRGVASCGWLPWIAALIPAESRGRYLTREAAVTNVASIAAFVVAALALGAGSDPSRFSSLFFFSTVCAIVSVVFLTRIPREPVALAGAISERPRFPQMLHLGAFRRLLAVNVCWSIGSGGVVTFLVAFLKEKLDLPAQTILLITALTFSGGVLNQLLLRTALDRHGSKPVMGGGLVLLFAVMALWGLVAAGVIGRSIFVVALLMFTVGLASSLFNLANIRLAMIVIPERGRSHYFAVFSVVSSVTLGLAPIAWGLMVDACHGIDLVIAGVGLNAYSILFAAFAGMVLVTWVAVFFLEEPEAGRLDDIVRGLLGKSRVRYWLRFWFRSAPRS
jgi:MFS family permease